MPAIDKAEGVEAIVLPTRAQVERAREIIRGLESTLAQTRDRIEQSQRRIAASDVLIKDLIRDLGREPRAEAGDSDSGED
jgi:hypothetical protein